MSSPRTRRADLPRMSTMFTASGFACGGLVFEAHRWLYHSTLGPRVIKKRKKTCRACPRCSPPLASPDTGFCVCFLVLVFVFLFGVWGLGFGVWGFGFRVLGLGSGVWVLGFGVLGLGFRDCFLASHHPNGAASDLIRTSICDNYSLSAKLLHSWIILVVARQRLVQIGRKDGPTEYLR